MAATNGDRQRAKRIRKKGDSASPAERAWLDAYTERTRSVKRESESAADADGAATLDVAATGTADADANTGVVPPKPPEPEPEPAPAEVIDMGDEYLPPPPVPKSSTPLRVIDGGKTTEQKQPVKLDGMTEEVGRQAAGLWFAMIGGGWSTLGDRIVPDPTAEQRRILARVIANYATKWGWTSELDDLILLCTVTGTYMIACAKAPRREAAK